MNELFRERFQGHETPVDPSAWDAIQSKLALGVPATDAMSKLFQEKFQGHEAAVDPSAWSNISSQLGHPAATGVSSFWGWAAAGVTALAIGGAALFMNNNTAVEVASVPQVTTDEQLPIVENKTLPVVIDTQTELVISAEQDPIAVSAVAPRSTDPVQRSTVASSVPEYSSPDPIVMDPANGSSMVTPGSEPQTPAQIGAGTINSVDGPVIVAQIIDEMTTKAAESATDAVETIPAIKDPSPQGSVEQVQQNTYEQPEAELKPLAPLPELFIPNTFTPNGDNINDTFEVIAEGYEKVMVRIFSVKENVQVFSTDNGTVWTGDNCSDGYYLVAVEAITKDGRSKTGSTMVWLNRNRLN